CNDGLWLHGALGQARLDLGLNLRKGATRRLYLPREWNRDGAAPVDQLRRKGHEVARSRAGLRRYDQTARARLENRHLHYIAYANPYDCRRRILAPKALEERSGPDAHHAIKDGPVDIEQGVVENDLAGVGDERRGRPINDMPGIRPTCGQRGAASH